VRPPRGRVAAVAPLLILGLVLSLAAGPAPAAPLPAPPSASAPAAAQAMMASRRSAAELMDAVMWQREPIGGPFRLMDAAGRWRRDSDFRGRIMLVVFGFTACPDICPTDLLNVGAALRDLGPAAAAVAPIFITLDPVRDTRPVLAAYLPSFHPQLTGLTGSVQAVRQVADAYRVYYAQVAVGGALQYTVDHSSFIYLMGRDGHYLGFLPPGSSAERIAQALRPHLPPPPDAPISATTRSRSPTPGR
jgi:protein SCO1/2